MKRLAGIAIAAGLVLGCQDREQVTSPQPGRISALVSDGGNGGNAHFYFLPPLVTQPTYSGTFNPSLKPLVEICHLTTDPTCAHFVTRFTPSQVSVDSQYKVNWNTDPAVLVSGHTYRVRVILGNIATNSTGSACPAATGFPADLPGCKEFGFRDVKPVATPQEVPKDQSVDLYVFLNGSTNPIKFRIEKGALCVANATDCGEGTVGTGGGNVLANFSNLSIPNGALSTVGDVTIIMQKVPCTVAGRVSFVPADLPQYEGCYDFRTFPENVTFNQNYIVGMCLKLPTGLSQTQQDKLQIHRWDPGAPPEALPEAAPQFPLNCADFASLGGNPLLNFARRTWRTFQREVGPWFSPPPLFAAHLLGGSGGKLSNLVWAIPSGMAKLVGDNQTALVSTAVAIPPSVKVTDPAGDPVAGATVRFVPSGDSRVDLPDADSVPCLSAPSDRCVRTNSLGVAQVVSWTLGTTAGTYTLVASGVGLAGSPTLSGDLPTGTLTFTATACKPGFGTATPNGVMAAGEWDCAQHQDFSANLSGGSSAPATLFWMNDATNLYLAVRVRRSSTDKVNTLQFNFDNNNSCPDQAACSTGAATENDDVLVVDALKTFTDAFLTLKCTTSTQSSCWSAAEPQIGAAGLTNNGTYTTYEFRHPLNSGDVHDFSRAGGSSVGLFLTLQLGSGAQGNTQWPGFRKYKTIKIEQP